MPVTIHSHARQRARERGATEAEIHATVEAGERFAVKHGRIGFRRNFAFDSHWLGRYYTMKQIEAIAVDENGDWLVLTVMVKFFSPKGD